MLILAVDTTTLSGSVALLNRTILLSEVGIDSSVTYSERLLPAIHFLLESQGLKIQDVNAFALAVGPGSFTGIRIGISTIKSFAYASKKPVAPISTLQAMALKLRHPQSRLLCPLIDAKKGEIYAALFESRGGKLQEIIPQRAYNPDHFFSLLPSRRIIFFIGSGAAVYRDKINLYLGDKARFSSRSQFIAYEVGVLGYELLKKRRGKEVVDIKPLYLRKSQAEENH